MTGMSVAKLNEALDRADRHSPHLRLLMQRHPDVRDLLAAGRLSDAIQHSFDLLPQKADPALPIGQLMRAAKGQLALAVAVGDWQA